jgi:hypothetical protein
MKEPNIDFIHEVILPQGHTEKDKNREVDGTHKNKKWHNHLTPNSDGVVNMSFELGGK